MAHKHDYVEWLRGTFYPPFNGFVNFLLGFGTTSELPPGEYAFTVPLSEEKLEKVFHDLEVPRNAPAKYKTLVADGRESEGSWRLTHHTHPEFVEPGMQLHITIFEHPSGDPSKTVVYAHYERDYMHDATGHLRGKDYSRQEGVDRARRLFRERTSIDIEIEKND